MDYSAILKKAWNIALKNRFLWVFGFLVGGFSSVNISYVLNGGSSNSGSSENPSEAIKQLPQLRSALRGLGIDVGLIVGIVLAFIVLGVVVAVVARLAQGALISSVRRIELGESPTLRSGFKEGWANLLALIGIPLAIWLPFGFFALSMVVALGGIIYAGYSINTLALVVAIVLAVVVFAALMVAGAALGILDVYAISYRIFVGEGVFDSITAAYRLLAKEKGRSAMLLLIVFGLSVAFGICAGIVGGLLVIPIAIGFVITPFIGVVLGIFALLLTGLAGSVAQTFFSGFWTLSFAHLSGLGAGEATNSDSEADNAL